MSKIGIDVDGVIAEFFSIYETITVQLTGRNLFPDRHGAAPPTWNWPQLYGYSNEEMSQVWAWIKVNPQFWMQSLTLPGSHNLMARLAFRFPSRKNDIYFITDRPGAGAKWITEKWIYTAFHWSATVLISSGGSKGLLAKGLSLDIFVEDKLENALDVAHATEGRCQSFLLDRPYNRPESGALFIPPPGFKRVKDIGELLDQEVFL